MSATGLLPGELPALVRSGEDADVVCRAAGLVGDSCCSWAGDVADDDARTITGPWVHWTVDQHGRDAVAVHAEASGPPMATLHVGGGGRIPGVLLHRVITTVADVR